MDNLDLQTITNNSSLFQCPKCGSEFTVADSDKVGCKAGHTFPVEKGLPLLFASHEKHKSEKDVTDAMRSFYMDNPFPDYEDFDSVGSLVERSQTSIFMRALDQAIPVGARVLEVGCGTGQASIFLSLAHREVFGVDLCPNSLQLARRFRDQHGLKGAHFYQMNLFRPIFRPESFDLVYCSGVLHHTSFPREGFESICKLVKPGKFIIIGLYNKYMRLPTHLRRVLSRFISIDHIDPVMRKTSTRKKRHTWFQDQYRNPHETDHTIHEVITWFEAAGFDYVNSIPSVRLNQTRTAITNPFQHAKPGSGLQTVLSQVLSTPTFAREGGLFLVTGRRRAANSSIRKAAP
jgi:SAM-dependent methyltransferase